MSRPRRGDAAIGDELVRERAARTPWKVLEARYGFCRARLWALWKEAAEKDVYKHLSACGGSEGGEGLALQAAPPEG